MTLLEIINKKLTLKYIDLFCGIGGFRIATEIVCKEFNIESQCVFSSDIDKDVVLTYEANFGETPHGDITKVAANAIPNHDILYAGFPCQPFSICGNLEGFDDTRGTLFFDIARILKAKKPYAFVLENVKQLKGHNKGKTLHRIISVLTELGYQVHYKVLNALEFGLPHKRERIFIIGLIEPIKINLNFNKYPMQPLSKILETKVSQKYYASDKIRQNRLKKYEGNGLKELTIWHENKSGHISAYPYSCAMRAGASYNYLLVNGERRLTEREMLRLQGFPDYFKVIRSYSATKKLVGNSVAIPCVTAIIREIFQGFKEHKSNNYNQRTINLASPLQIELFKMNSMDITTAKSRLDLIINKSRTRYYKPIQIAEVLYHSRVYQDIDVSNLEDYRTKSKKWRDDVSKILLDTYSTSSSRFQDDLWNNNAMPPEILKKLDEANKEHSGVVERYIYYRFIKRQSGIIEIVDKLQKGLSSPQNFYIEELLNLFRKQSGLKRSIDKCYEIITYSLFETIINSLETEITVKISESKIKLLSEFEDLTKVLLNIDTQQTQWTEIAHVYRVGVTNAADRGLDMWGNFGLAIQVKHLTLDEDSVRKIVDQIESDQIVIVCRDVDASIIDIVIQQIGWGKRVRGIIKESQLIEWYEKCLRGQFFEILASRLMELIIESFDREFPEATNYASKITNFCEQRNYHLINFPQLWGTKK